MTAPSSSLRRNRRFPSHGLGSAEVMSALHEAQQRDVAPHSDRNFRPCYYVNDEILKLIDDATLATNEINVLYAGNSFPSIKRFEVDLVAMGLDLLNAPEGAVGSVTTGGTESNFMAVKTARDWARAKRPEVAAPEMVVAHTAHASLDKAAHLLGLKVVRMKENVDFGADLAGMERAVGAQTIMIVGSAPPAPYGQVDPIAEIAALARRHGLWMHVDGCMGGFFLPFAKKLGEPIPDFDFAVPGVMSMSADLHKFGLAPKGASLILFADPEVGRFQSFEFSDWPYGTYVTANFAGSRPAAPIAAAWAVMNHLGEEGYLAVVRRLIEWRKQLIAGVLAIDGLGIVGRPSTAHFNVFAKDFDIYAVDEILAERGWHTGRGRSPDSIQFWVNYANERSFEALLADLKDAVATVRRTGRVRRVSEAVYSRS